MVQESAVVLFVDNLSSKTRSSDIKCEPKSSSLNCPVFPGTARFQAWPGFPDVGRRLQTAPENYCTDLNMAQLT